MLDSRSSSLNGRPTPRRLSTQGKSRRIVWAMISPALPSAQQLLFVCAVEIVFFAEYRIQNAWRAIRGVNFSHDVIRKVARPINASLHLFH